MPLPSAPQLRRQECAAASALASSHHAALTEAQTQLQAALARAEEGEARAAAGEQQLSTRGGALHAASSEAAALTRSVARLQAELKAAQGELVKYKRRSAVALKVSARTFLYLYL